MEMAKKNLDWLTHEQVIFCVGKIYPDLAHGREFWAGQQMEPGTNMQLTDAAILVWTADVPQPTQQEISKQWKLCGADYFAIELAETARTKRDELIKEADLLVSIALDQGDEDARMALSIYRRQLRDVPQQEGFPQKILWPKLPG